MRIIGNSSENTFIAEISSSEIAKAMNKWYDPLFENSIKIGDEFDLGGVHKIRDDIKDCCKQIARLSDSYKKAEESLYKFSQMVIEQNLNKPNK